MVNNVYTYFRFNQQISYNFQNMINYFSLFQFYNHFALEFS